MRAVFFAAPWSTGGASRATRRAPARLTAFRPMRALAADVLHLPPETGCRLWAWPGGVPPLAHDALRLRRRLALRPRNRMPVVLGGDHTTAIGVWPSLRSHRRPLGLLWIDAHLDSHTPMTSLSQRLHGMPLALLLQEGDPRLHPWTQPIVDAGHSTVFGARSFEPGEPERLKRLGIRYYTMTEIRQRGLMTCLREAWRRVSSCPGGFGISLDVDGLDPRLAPGVSLREPGGLDPARMAMLLRRMPKRGLRGLEIAEYNPGRDRHGQTLKRLAILAEAILRGRWR